jgi:hypothetical protein
MASVMLGVFWLVCFQVLWKGYLIQKRIERGEEEEEDR